MVKTSDIKWLIRAYQFILQKVNSFWKADMRTRPCKGGFVHIATVRCALYKGQLCGLSGPSGF